MPFSCQPPSTAFSTEPLAGAGSSAEKLTTNRWRTSKSAGPFSNVERPLDRRLVADGDRQHGPLLAADVQAGDVVLGVARACTTRGSSCPCVGRIRRLACSESYQDFATENVGRTSANAG